MNVDTDLMPFRPRDAEKIVEQVLLIGDRSERHYLEIKSRLDLHNNDHIIKIVKFILGASNRTPEIAQKAFHGYAVMIIGVDSGRKIGIDPIEKLDLDRRINKYLGANGPEWDIVRVAADHEDKEVLLIVVDPPKKGVAPAVSRKTSQGIVDGRIYIRADGETREANCDEFDQLMTRYSERSDVVGDFDISFESVPIIEGNRLSILDWFVDQVHDSLESVLPPDFLLGLQSMMTISGYRDTRSVEEYKKEFIDWEKRIRLNWDNIYCNILSLLLEPVSIVIRNNSNKCYENLIFEFEVDGRFDVIRAISSNDRTEITASKLAIPKIPRKWGSGSVRASSAFSVPTYFPKTLSLKRVELKIEEKVKVALELRELRPQQAVRVEDREFILFSESEDVPLFEGRWTATASRLDSLLEGSYQTLVDQKVELNNIIKQTLSDLI